MYTTLCGSLGVTAVVLEGYELQASREREIYSGLRAAGEQRAQSGVEGLPPRPPEALGSHHPRCRA